MPYIHERVSMRMKLNPTSEDLKGCQCKKLPFASAVMFRESSEHLRFISGTMGFHTTGDLSLSWLHPVYGLLVNSATKRPKLVAVGEHAEVFQRQTMLIKINRQSPIAGAHILLAVTH
ncbi:hypothetical protein N7516_011207 [Penicillium verrucosum]|uniref:uncharacterized protein n=1 Tax=Penicillium verrucosum TaxID=60171 RepID=UPI00254585FA|nr:uncharacterized protein N7516_011207 [Penicillium verrucosum]KAJ5920349.1 hypothetical protein N7516_011207 [Penicillium verrucosum]